MSKNDNEVLITIKSKTISYSGKVTIRKAHKLLQLIADEERPRERYVPIETQPYTGSPRGTWYTTA